MNNAGKGAQFRRFYGRFFFKIDSSMNYYSIFIILVNYLDEVDTLDDVDADDDVDTELEVETLDDVDTDDDVDTELEVEILK